MLIDDPEKYPTDGENGAGNSQSSGKSRDSSVEDIPSALDSRLVPGAYRKEPGIDVLDVLILLARSKWLILGITLSSTFVAAFCLLQMRDTYRSMATFTVAQKAQWDLDAFIVINSGSGSIANEAYGFKADPVLYTDILRTSGIVRAVARSLDLVDGPIELVEKMLRSGVHIDVTEEGIISVAVEHKNPQLAADLANAYVAELYELSQSTNRQGLSKNESFLLEASAQVRGELGDLERELSAMQCSQGVVNLLAQSTATLELDVELRRDLTGVEVRIARLLESKTERSQEVILLRSEETTFRDKILRLERGEGNPDPVGFRSLPEKSRRIRDLERAVQNKGALWNLLCNQLGMARLRQKQPNSSIILLDRAEVPTYRVRPQRKKLTVAACMGGFMVGVLVALTREGYRRARKDGPSRVKLQCLVNDLLAPPFRRTSS